MTDTTLTENARPRRVRRGLIVAVVLLAPLAIHAVWDQVESTLLARDIAAIARRGEPVNVVTRRAALSDPESRRSAALYAAAADLARWQSQGYAFENKDIEDHTTDALFDAAKVQTYLADSEPALQLLNAATPLRFTEFANVAPELYTNESSLQALNAMNCVSADALSVRGEAARAADVLLRSIRLQRTMPIPFYRTFSSRRLYGSLRILLNRAPPDADSLRRLQAALEEWPDDDGIIGEVLRRRAELLGEFWPYPAERKSWALRPQEFRYRNMGTTLAFVVLRPFLTHLLRRELRPYEEALAVARAPWPRKLDAAHDLEQRYRTDLQHASQWRTLGFIRVPPAGAIINLADLPWGGANLAIRRTAIATIAVERFRRDHTGQPPASLQALVPAYLRAVPDDPFSGKPLILTVDAGSYAVYSVDIDRRDDGGVFSGTGTGVKERWRRLADTAPGDIGIRVSLMPQR
jgi:hypothetical protein